MYVRKTISTTLIVNTTSFKPRQRHASKTLYDTATLLLNVTELPAIRGCGIAAMASSRPKSAGGDQHAILVAIWTMAHTGALFDDPGADYYTRRNPERTRRNAVNQLQRLGYQVTLTRSPPQHKRLPPGESSRQSHVLRPR
jgi:hypothetical protein